MGCFALWDRGAAVRKGGGCTGKTSMGSRGRDIIARG